MTAPGDPAAMTAAADTLARVSGALDRFAGDVGRPVRATIGEWRGSAAPVAARRIDADLDLLARAVEVCRVVVPALRFHAETLERARADVLLGEQYDDPATGSMIVDSAHATLDAAAEDVARVIRDATELLPGGVDTEGGNALDGLRKAGADALDEIGSTLSGAWDHINVFSDDFGETWAQTAATARAVATDPMAAGRAIVDSIAAPIAESYRTGGVDEAVARGVGTIATALVGGKGVTKLASAMAPDGPPGPTGDPVPASMRRVPDGGLKRHDELGGHTYDKKKAHVGATDAQMQERLARERGRERVSSFPNWLVAERAGHDVINARSRDIQAWLSNPDAKPTSPFYHDHGQVVGRSATRDGTVAEVTGSTVMLKKDPDAPLGYYVLSSYPGR